MVRIAHILLSCLLLAGCVVDPEDGDDFGQVEEGIVGPNGKNLNGKNLNGKNLNGVALNGVTLNGKNLNGTLLVGSQLTGLSPTGALLRGTGMVGTTYNATATDGTPYTLRIDSATLLTGANTDVWSYGVSFKNGTTWAPLCGAGVGALAVTGRWNSAEGVPGGGSYIPDLTQFTFACRGFAIAKCVEMGYKPWKLLSGHMAACTRMLRADYCGNGVSFTVDGTPINVYDGLGIQVDTESWPVDAEWTPAGARCMGPNAPARVQETVRAAPSCFGSLVKHTCGSPFSFVTGTFLIDEAQ
jgi:hypothetical protein